MDFPGGFIKSFGFSYEFSSAARMISFFILLLRWAPPLLYMASSVCLSVCLYLKTFTLLVEEVIEVD